MNDPASSFFRKLNRSLRDMGADMEIGATCTVPATIRFGDGAFVHETTLDVKVTGRGWEIVDVERQVRRIEDEILARFEGE